MRSDYFRNSVVVSRDEDYLSGVLRADLFHQVGRLLRVNPGHRNIPAYPPKALTVCCVRLY